MTVFPGLAILIILIKQSCYYFIFVTEISMLEKNVIVILKGTYFQILSKLLHSWVTLWLMNILD